MNRPKQLSIVQRENGYQITIAGTTQELTVMLSVLIHSLKENSTVPNFLIASAFCGAMDGVVDRNLRGHNAQTVSIDMSALSHTKEADVDADE